MNDKQDEFEKLEEALDDSVSMVDDRTIINVSSIPKSIVKSLNRLSVIIEDLGSFPDSDDIKKVFSDAARDIEMKFPTMQKVSGKVDVDFPDTQKVEVTNQKKVQKVEVINTIAPPEVQKVKITNPTKAPDIQKVSVKDVVSTRAVDMPTGEGKEASREADPTKFLIVRLSNGREFVGGLGQAAVAGGAPLMEKVWLREQYTVDGNNNTTKIERWDGQFKMVEDIEYDGSNNAIVKSRSIEPNAVVGS